LLKSQIILLQNSPTKSYLCQIISLLIILPTIYKIVPFDKRLAQIIDPISGTVLILTSKRAIFILNSLHTYIPLMRNFISFR